MAYVEGYRGQVEFDGNVLHVQRFQIHIRTSIIDVTNFVYYDFAAYATSLKDAEITCDVIYDPNDFPFDVNVTSVRPGHYVNGSFEFDKTKNTTNATWTFPLLAVLSVRHNHAVRDVSRFSLTLRPLVTGPLSTPTFAVHT